jgi:hypothetical protein
VAGTVAVGAAVVAATGAAEPGAVTGVDCADVGTGMAFCRVAR